MKSVLLLQLFVVFCCLSVLSQSVDVVDFIEEHTLQFKTRIQAMNQSWITQDIDHFNWRTKGTFQQRYFVDATYWKPNGPIFLYTGNESPIETFIANTGFPFELAPSFGALVVFVEHRYYGQSFPFGTAHSALEPGHVDYLTVEQALADFAVFISYLKSSSPYAAQAEHSAVICFGGSYGAELAMWMRTKYPNLVAGAVASSGPPLKSLMRSTNAFNRIVTEVYANVSASCPVIVRQAFNELMEKAKTVEGRQEISELLHICTPLPSQDSAQIVYNWIYDGLETLVQYGYPYPSSFDNPVPAFPFKVACEAMLNFSHTDLLAALGAAVNVYYNWTGEGGPCYTLFDNIEDPTDIAWDYQCCTEVYQPMPADGITDMFLPYTPNATALFATCNDTFGVTPRPDWEELTLWGGHIEAASNLFITNGQLDPWRSGGIQQCPRCGQSVIIRELEGAAHHLDLRASNPLDPVSVILVREEEKRAISDWIKEWNQHVVTTRLMYN